MSRRDQLNAIFAKDFDLEESKWRGPFDFVERGSNSLFVTIGDSWTYGWRLDEETTADKEQYRIDHTYGGVISQHLGWDFLNVSIPASNNLWMVEKFQQICANAGQLGYDRIKVFITLTEYGREFYTDFDGAPELQESYKSCRTPDDVACALSNHVADLILKTNNVEVNLGINYVSNLYPQKLQSQIVPLSWLEILCGNSIAEKCIVVGSWVIPKYEHIQMYHSLGSNAELKEHLQDLVDRSEKRIDIIYNTGYNHRIGYGHPNSDGHNLWAKYIMNTINF